MRRVGQTRRRDANEPSIMEDLRKAGVHVTQVSGKGAPDLILKFRGSVICVEVKSENGKRTPAQEDTDWPIVKSALDCMRLLAEQGK